MQIQWFEQLPSECPPLDSKECKGTFYRIAKGNPATSSDFFSQRKLAPEKIFKGKGIDECITNAISVFSTVEDARRLKKLPKFKNATIAEIKLKPSDGKIKKTFRNSHYSWWRSITFDVSQAQIIE